MIRKRWGRRWKGLVVLFVLFFVFPGMAQGAPGQIRLEVYPGYGGVYKGDWIPVRVRITNSGSDIEGELIVRSAYWPIVVPDSRLFVSERVRLAGGTSKEVTLLLSGAEPLTDAVVQFRGDGGVVARKRIGGERIADSELLVGVLGESPDLSSRLGQWLGTAEAPRARVQHVTAEEIPEKDAGLSGLDVLVVNGIDFGTLGSSRQTAIRRWVENGGLLVVAGVSPSASSFGELESILPVKVEGTAMLKDLSPFSRWGSVPDLDSPLPVSRTRLIGGGKSVISAEELPLLARRSVGAGAVLYAGYDLAAAPLVQWEGNGRLWREMLILGGGGELPLPLFEKLAPMEQALLKMPHLRLPSLPAVATLFLLYALTVGPAAFRVLSRIKRREWAWWIIPSLGIAVALGIYTYGQVIRGDHVLVHNLAYVESKASGEGRVLGVSGFVTQEAGAYRLEGNPDMRMWPLFQGEQRRYDVKVSQKPSVTFRRLSHWTLRKVFVETTTSLGGELRAVIRYQDGKLRGEVTNGTRLPLRDVTVNLGNRAHLIGDLASGETREFEVNYVPDREGRTGDHFDPAPMEAEMSEPTREDLMRIEGEEIRVAGWTEEPVFSYGVQGYDTKEEHQSLVLGRVEAKPREKGGNVLWPRGTVSARSLESQSLVFRYYGEAVPEKEMENSVLVAYDLPSAPLKWKPLRIDFEPKSGVEVYNWRKGEWVPVRSLSGMSPEELSAFLSSFDRLVIRMDHAGIYPALEVEGRVAE